MVEHSWIFVALILLLALGLMWPGKTRADRQSKRQRRETLR